MKCCVVHNLDEPDAIPLRWHLFIKNATISNFEKVKSEVLNVPSQ